MTPPAALAAGDLDGLFLVATRPSGDSDNNRDAAAANGVGAGVMGGCGVRAGVRVVRTSRFEVQKEHHTLTL